MGLSGFAICAYTTRVEAQADNVKFSGLRDPNLGCTHVLSYLRLFLSFILRSVSDSIPEAPMIKTSYDLPVFTTLILQVILSTIVAAAPRCWNIDISPRPIVFRDCNEIIVHGIGKTYDPSRRPFDPSRPLIFSRDRGLRPDVRIPKTWYDEERRRAA